jgi:hybrid cluster-associated redox disulfide protein
MRYEQFSDLCVSEIMERWPTTIGVFIDYGMHCIGCPIGIFHTLSDAADEHGIPVAVLEREIAAAIAEATKAGPARVRHRSAPAGAGLLPGASAVPLPPDPHLPRR